LNGVVVVVVVVEEDHSLDSYYS
jgi:hypothetical protein